MTKQQHFAAVLRKARDDSGFTQKEFGRILGVDQATICEWEKGKHCQYIVKSAGVIRGLAKFGVTIEDVAG